MTRTERNAPEIESFLAYHPSNQQDAADRRSDPFPISDPYLLKLSLDSILLIVRSKVVGEGKTESRQKVKMTDRPCRLTDGENYILKA